jgi:hypothetical protein
MALQRSAFCAKRYGTAEISILCEEKWHCREQHSVPRDMALQKSAFCVKRNGTAESSIL